MVGRRLSARHRVPFMVMRDHGRLIIALGALCCALAFPGAAVARTGSPYRLWHGTLIKNLDAGPSLTAHAAVARRLGPGESSVLSNERTYTRWANPAYLGPIFSQPDGSSKRLGRLHWRTEDGFPEVYLLLREHITNAGYPWVQLRIPGRPNGRTGWVRRSALGRYNMSHWLIVVNRDYEQMTAYNFGRKVFQAPVGVGKPSTPTPSGHFWIRERFRVMDPSSPYFPYAMGTADYSTLSEWPGGGVVGIHGAWGQPWLIPGDPSHGCIRMHNNNDAWLVPRVPVGTPLHVI